MSDHETLAGKFFHELDESRAVQKQGTILAEPYPRVFVVQRTGK